MSAVLDAPAAILSRSDFERVKRMIRERAGIALADTKCSMVQGRLARRLRETGQASFADYLDRLERDADAREWQLFVNALTTNLTSFFREQYHFPVLLEALRAHGAGPVRIWCAAASTGEEPYSIAITVAESGRAADARIFASDIDTSVLERAARGVYPADTRGLSEEQRKRFFLRGKGANAGLMRVRPDLARMVEFGQLNLVSPPWPFCDSFDVVFCRNVMIYFSKDTQRAVLESIHRVMRPGGLLFVGHSENFTAHRDLFMLRGKTIYERAGRRGEG